MSKYDALSGKSLSSTPYGVLDDAIVFGFLTIYLNKNECYSFDRIRWDPMNHGLYKRLAELAEYGYDNVIIVEEDNERRETD